jgi:hypothetical protein
LESYHQFFITDQIIEKFECAFNRFLPPSATNSQELVDKNLRGDTILVTVQISVILANPEPLKLDPPNG